MGLFDLFTGVEADYMHIESSEFLQKVNENVGQVSIIDVRTNGEYANGHIPGAKNINVMGPKFTNQIQNLDREQTHYIICASGNRSKTACSIMSKKGFKKVINVRGGMMNWKGKVA